MTMVCTMSALLTNCPVDVWKRGQSAVQQGNKERMMALCLRTVQAAQRTSFDDVAPRRLPHVHVWARWTPFAWGSVLEAGRVRDTVSDSTVI